MRHLSPAWLTCLDSHFSFNPCQIWTVGHPFKLKSCALEPGNSHYWNSASPDSLKNGPYLLRLHRTAVPQTLNTKADDLRNVCSCIFLSLFTRSFSVLHPFGDSGLSAACRLLFSQIIKIDLKQEFQTCIFFY